MYWWILDLVTVILLVIGFAAYYRKGLLAAAVGIVGVIAAVLLSMWGSDKLTPYVYDNFVKQRIVSAVNEKVDIDGALSSLTAGDGKLAGLLGELGLSAPEAAEGEAAEGTEAVADEESLSEKLADAALGTSARSITRVALAIIIFMVAILLIRLLTAFLRKANGIPVLGAVNKLCGGVLGLAVGALWSYVFVSLCAITIKVTFNSFSWLNTDMVDRTIVFSLIYPYNLLNLLS